jgi:hypothetical protein
MPRRSLLGDTASWCVLSKRRWRRPTVPMKRLQSILVDAYGVNGCLPEPDNAFARRKHQSPDQTRSSIDHLVAYAAFSGLGRLQQRLDLKRRRTRSTTFARWSHVCSIDRLCASENRLFFSQRSAGTNMSRWTNFRGSRQYSGATASFLAGMRKTKQSSARRSRWPRCAPPRV